MLYMKVGSSIKKETNHRKLDELGHAKDETYNVNFTGYFHFHKFFLIDTDEFFFICKGGQGFVILDAISGEEMGLFQEILSVLWETLCELDVELGSDYQERDCDDTTQGCLPAVERANDDPDN